MIGFALFLLVLVVIVVWGFRVKPTPFPLYPQRTPSLEMAPLPENLPPPVQQFYQAIVGHDVPILESVVITAQATLKFGGVPVPARMRFTHRAGYDYRHYIEVTWFNRALLKVNEHCRDGLGYMQLPMGTIEDTVELNSAGNQAVWGEGLFFPTLFVTDTRMRWEMIDTTTARLIVPYPHSQIEPNQEFIVTFDPETHLITRMETLRYRDAKTGKVNWILEASDWKKVNGMLLPMVGSVTWADQNFAWLSMTIKDIVFNVDVSDYILQKGL